MERLRTIKLHIFALAMMMFLVLGMSVGCDEEKKKDELNDSQGGTSGGAGNMFYTLDNECIDGADNDRDSNADRYGVPEHCTIGMPVASLNNTTLAKFFAVGSYGRSVVVSDTYTITVQVSGGSGIAQISWTSTLTDNSQANATVLLGVPVLVGRYGLVIYFTEDDLGQYFLNAGDFWTVNTIPSDKCFFQPDPGCYPPDSINEWDVCWNGVDDDFDWFSDINDPECHWLCTFGGSTISKYDPTWISEDVAFLPECGDGIDNDLDGFIDGADTRCQVTIMSGNTIPVPILVGNDCLPFE